MAASSAEEFNTSGDEDLSSAKTRRPGGLADLESCQTVSKPEMDLKEGREFWTTMRLAFQSLGVVYGDIGTSPLYVYASTFQDGIKHDDDILGVLSLIFYTITLIVLVKYIFVVLRANDNGHGGTFALYSLVCRNARVGMIPRQQAEDGEQLVNFGSAESLPAGKQRQRASSRAKAVFENSMFAKYVLLTATMLGTAMVIGDGVLTPCISVLSAVGGLKEATEAITQGAIAWISVAILVVLFMGQRFGTDKVGYSFAPIITVWFAFNAGVGVYNLFKYDPSGVVRAVNPIYIVRYFVRNGKLAWVSLGGVVLCITGVEALFADLGHFSVQSIQMSMSAVVFPSLVLAYTGQASFLRRNKNLVADTFYKSIPGPMYWPMFVVALLAAIIASQAMISGTFSIIQQSLSLGCFPRVKVIHTSVKHGGQIYIPEVNHALMLACVAVTVAFKSTTNIGNAYGIAIVFVMTLTSAFLVLIMIMIWKTNFSIVILYVVVIGGIELLYLTSVLYKFIQGGYLPLSFSVFLISVMLLWNYVHNKKYIHDLEHKGSAEKLQKMAASPGFNRIPGLALFYSELTEGVPPIFEHYIDNVPALHAVVVLVSIKSLPVSKVPATERFLFRRVGPGDLFVFRCVAKYGYRDHVRSEEEPFVEKLVQGLKKFVGEEGEEVVEKEWRKGVVHLLGESEVVAKKGSAIWKRAVIDYAYSFLRKNLRQQDEVFTVPRSHLLKVGMAIEL